MLLCGNCRDYKSNKIFLAAFVVGFAVVVGGVDRRLAVAARALYTIQEGRAMCGINQNCL